MGPAIIVVAPLAQKSTITEKGLSAYNKMLPLSVFWTFKNGDKSIVPYFWF